MRLAGWEERLAALVAAADTQPYMLGSFDCFRLACAAVAACTGRDVWPLYAGRYRTRAESIRMIRSVDPDLRAAIGKVFALPQIPVKQAGRGDIYLFEDRLPHLGVGLGPFVGVLAEGGLGLLRIDDPGIKAAWSVA